MSRSASPARGGTIGNTPAEFQAFIKSEAAKAAKVVKAAKITVN